MTAEDWAPYGLGEPDADGWYPDYRPVPAALKPEAQSAAVTKPEVDGSWTAIVLNWRIVVAELAREFGIDLYDPAIRDRPWMGVRTMIFALLESPSRLRQALTIRDESRE